MTKTRTTPITTICHRATAQAAPKHAVTQTTAAVVKSLYVMAFLASDNHARTQKTDASHDALNHAAGVAAGYRMDGQNCQGRAETQDAEGAHASRLSMQIAVQAEHDSDQGCSTEPKRNVEIVHSRGNFSTTASREGSPREASKDSAPGWVPAVLIEGEYYWDGGVYSNSPIEDRFS